MSCKNHKNDFFFKFWSRLEEFRFPVFCVFWEPHSTGRESKHDYRLSYLT